MKKIYELSDGWTLNYNGKKIAARVPGDITLDLYQGGIVKNPYFGLNHKELHWIAEQDFVYETTFSLPEDIFLSEEILLEFDGIDTFAEILLNDVVLGNTENMFLKYTFSVKEHAKRENNRLCVRMSSTLRRMNAIDDRGYFGVFNTKRLFIRKAQCHFGWDWAPDMPGYGIYGGVRVKGVAKNRIEQIHYKTCNDGRVSLFAEFNYTTRPYIDFQGNVIKKDENVLRNDTVRFTLATQPGVGIDEGETKIYVCKVSGKKVFANFFLPDVQLWWPMGYGAQPLYEYRVELLRDEEILDEVSGKLAFREIRLLQQPIDENNIGYRIAVNGIDIFVKGSNWVPIECFTGNVQDEKYEKLINKAVNGNFNMLRVWGGGIYEKDIFYDLCDQKGVMVWQDVMLACADIPEDDPLFVDNVKKEVKYQIQRLRNHPSIVYWCGGNEKTGTYGLQICHGDEFVDVVLRGLINDLDDTRPYARQSPCSLTDIGNDRSSGESHAGSYETCLTEGVLKYREKVAETVVPFLSECAVMGPGSVESFKKMFPEDKLWPMNEYWTDRLMDNPYSSVLMDFPARQKLYVDTLYGSCKNLSEFVCKGMTVHAEIMRAEIEHARFQKGKCWGFMNWMFSDIWPSATWSVVDYFCEPKQVYYQMRRSYAPILVTFVQTKGNTTMLAGINDTEEKFSSKIEYGMRMLDGKTIWKKEEILVIPPNGVYSFALESEIEEKNAYLYVETMVNGTPIRTTYSRNMWHTCEFSSDYTYTTEYVDGGLKVHFRANAYAKGITLRFPQNDCYDYSDNYFDLEAGERKSVFISSSSEIKSELLTVTDFAKETAGV